MGLSLTLVAAGPGWGASGYVLVPKSQEVRQLDLQTGALLQKLSVPMANVYHNCVRTSDGLLLVASNDALSVIETRTGRLEKTIPLPTAIVSAGLKTSESDIPVLQSAPDQARRLIGLDYSPRTSTAYLAVQNDDDIVTLYKFDVRTRNLQVLSTLKDITAPKDLAVTADGLRIYLSAIEVLPEPSGRLYSINPVTGLKSTALPIAFDPKRAELALSIDGNLLFLTAADESVIVVNTRSNASVKRLRVNGPGEKSRIQRVLPALDNRHLWVLTKDRLLLWDPFSSRAVVKQDLKSPVLDLVMSADKSRLWALHATTGVGGEIRVLDSAQDSLPVLSKFSQPEAGNRLMLTESPATRPGGLQLPRVAVVGFETGPARYGRYPNVADVISGDLLWTGRYEILPPLQVQSVLESLDLSRAQLQGSADSIQQVAVLLGADVVLVGEPLRVEMPNRNLEALAGLFSPIASLLLPQLSSPKVFTQAEAFDYNGKSLWKANVVNSDSAFFAGKGDTTLLSNAMVITGHDIANKFSQGVYNEVKAKATQGDLPPLLKDSALKDVKRVALLGPDSALFNEQTNSPESLGQLIAPRLSDALGWEVDGPDVSFARLAELGLEPVQVLTTEPKLLARALGVDAVMLGLVRSSTYISGGFIGLSQNAAADVVLQFELVDQQGRVLWKDIQVRNIPTGLNDGGSALRQAAKAIVERLEGGVQSAQNPSTPQRKSNS